MHYLYTSVKSYMEREATYVIPKRRVDYDPITGPYPGLSDSDLVTTYMRWHTIRCVVAGFENLGNSCYLNATLQCLLHIPVLTQLFLHAKYKELQDIKDGIIQLYRK